jgi:hypothetical protein
MPPAIPWRYGLHVLAIGIDAAQDQGAQPLRDGLGQAQPGPAAHGVAQVVDPVEGEGIEHRQDIGHAMGKGIGVRVVRLVAGAVPSGIDHDQPEVALEPCHPAGVVPAGDAVAETVLQHQRWPLAGLTKVDPDSLVVDIGHGGLSAPEWDR